MSQALVKIKWFQNFGKDEKSAKTASLSALTFPEGNPVRSRAFSTLFLSSLFAANILVILKNTKHIGENIATIFDRLKGYSKGNAASIMGKLSHNKIVYNT